MLTSPAFGQADLSNCERELIHLAGSVQPHGVLLVIDVERRVLQATANAAALLGHSADSLLGRPLADLGGDLDARVAQSVLDLEPERTAPLTCSVDCAGTRAAIEGGISCLPGLGWMVEIEPLAGAAETVSLDGDLLIRQLGSAIQQLSTASSLGVLADGTVKAVRELTGYDRVMVYRFDPDGHGKVIAEARHPRLEPLLGHHYPATDIPQRARELYLRNRVRVLVDVDYTPSPLVPRRPPGHEAELDMSLSYLRSMSPLHLQYLKNMGVTATLVVSLVREGRLWGLIACHHDAPRNLRYAVRTAAELIAEVVVTRIAAIENYAQAQVAIRVRQLEQRLIDATSVEGDWRHALLRQPQTLLQPLEATGAALFYEDEIQTTGEVPSTPELRNLRQWVDRQTTDGLYASHAVARDHPEFGSLTATASGVLAVRLSAARPDYLMWFRKEQLLTVTWAGDPHKPMEGNDPLELSPRRSFAAWSEIVRGTAAPWAPADLALARAIGAALVDIILQVYAVRLLVAEHQLTQVRRTVVGSSEPVVIADANGRLMLANAAFLALAQRPSLAAPPPLASLEDLATLFVDSDKARRHLNDARQLHKAWRGELALTRRTGEAMPVGVRLETVSGPGGRLLGFVVILLDFSARHRASAARRQLEESLQRATRGTTEASADAVTDVDQIISSIVTNASIAAMDIADGANGASLAPQLEELDASAQRAALLYQRILQAARRG
ncbi:MAG: GAF domain-containing protein [Burkholderiaceae bacterium]|nr:GAF domain-containing protein [Burkholderiaceae bacterium]